MMYDGIYQDKLAGAASKSMSKWPWNCASWGLTAASVAMTGLSWAGWLGPFPVGAILGSIPVLVHWIADRSLAGRFIDQYTNLLRGAAIANATTPEELFANALAVAHAFHRLSSQVKALEPAIFRSSGADPFKMTVDPAIRALREVLKNFHALGLGNPTDKQSIRSQFDQHLQNIEGMVPTRRDGKIVEESKLTVIQREWMFFYRPLGLLSIGAAGGGALLNLSASPAAKNFILESFSYLVRSVTGL
jgi:hypothetical protein